MSANPDWKTQLAQLLELRNIAHGGSRQHRQLCTARWRRAPRGCSAASPCCARWATSWHPTGWEAVISPILYCTGAACRRPPTRHRRHRAHLRPSGAAPPICNR